MICGLLFESKNGKDKIFNKNLYFQKKENLESLRDGLTLSDGSMSEKETRISFDSTSISLISAYKNLSDLIHCHPHSLTKRDSRFCNRGYNNAESYKLRRAKNNNRNRKDQKYLEDDKYFYLPITSLELLEAKDTKVYDLQVENDPSFVIYNMVVHNSGCSFYINKLLGFTEVDRLESPVELFPTRFMSESRILETKSLADIDLNTKDPEPFIQATKELLGETSCYPMIAFGTMQESEALRNLCRAKQIPIEETNTVAKDIESYRNHSIWGELIEESQSYIGAIDSMSQHPCSVLIMSEDILEEVGVIKVGDVYCAVIDSYYSDVFKYLKNDFLTVTVTKIIDEAFKRVGIETPDVRSITSLVEDDDKVWNLYRDGIVSTLNQAGTASGKPQVMQYSPQSIRELTGWVSAIRPSFSSMKSYFLNREPFSYGIPTFDNILESSDNFILYQENIMAVLVYAGFDEDVTYGLLKAIAKKKEGIIEPIHDKFINGFKKRVIEEDGTDELVAEEQALKVWRIIEDAVGYGFNASHAYAVALDSVYGAYLKAHYPLEYYATVLEIYQDSVSKTGEIVNELSYFNIELKSIEYGKSGGNYRADAKTNSVYKGIASIKYLNNDIGERFLEMSKNKELSDLSWVEFCQYIIDNKVAQTNQMDILIRLDFFKKFGEKEVLLELHKIMTDKKKLNVIKYPEFSPQTIRVEKKNKKGEIRYEEKVVKYPVKYDSKHKEETKLVRLKNLNKLYSLLKERKPEKISLYEQISFEKDYLGYAYSKWENLDTKICLVLDINTKFTPLVTFYQVATGKEFFVKVKKKFFWENDQEQMIYSGDVIKIDDIGEEPSWKKVDEKWVQNHEKLELHLRKCTLLRKSKERKQS